VAARDRSALVGRWCNGVIARHCGVLPPRYQGGAAARRPGVILPGRSSGALPRPIFRPEGRLPVRSIAWMSEKGGSAKTTCAVNTAVCLAKSGLRTLCLDCDPQGNATMVLLGGREPEGPTLFHVLTDDTDAGGTVIPTTTPGLDLIPSDARMADANSILAGEVGRERRLRLAMRGVDEAYDFVIVDTSPQRSVINANVLNYVAEVLAPVDPGIFSLAGLVKLQGAVAEVVRFLDNQALRVAGLVLTRATNDNLARDVEGQLRSTFGPLVYKTVVPASTKVGEAHARFLSVLDYAPRSPGAKAYQALTREIIDHGQAEHGVGNVGHLDPAPDGPEGRPGRPGRGPRRAAG
jgi:chromosome partitioning protein